MDLERLTQALCGAGLLLCASCVAELDLAEGVEAEEGSTTSIATSGATNPQPTGTADPSAGGVTGDTDSSLDASPVGMAFAIDRCETIAACGCVVEQPWNAWNDIESCIGYHATIWAQREAFALEAGLFFNEACHTLREETLIDETCEVEDAGKALVSYTAAAQCPLWVGEAEKGEACVGHFEWGDSNCRAGLVCAQGVCVPRPQTGDACVFSDALPSGCEPDAYCLNATSCVSLPEPEDPCLEDGKCGRHLLCGDDGRCEHPLEDGSACLVEGICESLRCVNDVCAPTLPRACDIELVELPPI